MPDYPDEVTPMLTTGNQKPVPIIDGLEVFEIEMNGDDVTLTGKYRVQFVLLPHPEDNSFRGVIDDIRRRKLILDKRIVMERIFESKAWGDANQYIIGVFDEILEEKFGGIFHRPYAVGSFRIYHDGRRLCEFYHLTTGFIYRTQFVAVVSRTRIE